MPRQIVSEKASTLTAQPVKGKSGEFVIQLITPGWGSSGYYAAPVLEAAGKAGVFPSGTHMYVNHQTASERNDRPEGDLTGLAAVLQEDAYWDGSALVARAKPFQHWAPVLAEMKDSIGVSIRASAEISEGSAEGRNGIIVDELVEAQSVDFVTRAGRGGKIREILESARSVDEALTDDRRSQLNRMLPPKSYLRDYDDAVNEAYYVTYDDNYNESRVFRQPFSLDNDKATALVGAAVEVIAQTTYVPVSSAGQTTESQKGNTVQIDDARFAQLNEAAGKVPTLIAERDDLQARAEKAEADLAEAKMTAEKAEAASVARDRATEAAKALPLLAVARVVAESTRDLPMRDGKLDLSPFDATVAEAVKAETDYIAALAPQGITGFGASAGTAQESVTAPSPWRRNSTGKVA